MIASLPMYERAETAGAHDRFWDLIRSEYRGADAAPEALTRGGDPWLHWCAPDLFLSQTCGLPYRTRLHGTVTLIGAPDYGVGDTPPGHYRSVIVVAKDDARDGLSDFGPALWAVNDALSQSGWAAPSAHLSALGLAPVARVLVTGAHLASARAVAHGAADIAALDAVSWRLIRRYEGWAEGLRVLVRTTPTPGLPLIAGPGRDGPAIAAAVTRAIGRLDGEDREELGGLRGFVPLSPDAYLALPAAPPLPDCATNHA